MTGAFFYCNCLTSGNSSCLSTAAAMLSQSHEIISKKDYNSLFFMQRRLWRVCTFAQAQLSLCPGTEISCAGSFTIYGTLVYKNSECCGEAAPATTGIVCNHQCVVSMRQNCSQCVVIKIPQ